MLKDSVCKGTVYRKKEKCPSPKTHQGRKFGSFHARKDSSKEKKTSSKCFETYLLPRREVERDR